MDSARYRVIQWATGNTIAAGEIKAGTAAAQRIIINGRSSPTR